MAIGLELRLEMFYLEVSRLAVPCLTYLYLLCLGLEQVVWARGVPTATCAVLTHTANSRKTSCERYWYINLVPEK